MWDVTESALCESLAPQPEIPHHSSIRPETRSRPSKEQRFEAEVRAFAEAMQAYKQSSGRMFPTWSETLEVLRSLGYRKPGDD
jgi:hypothetical protein